MTALQNRRREDFMDALEAFIDARIRDDQADAEWRMGTPREKAELDRALERLLEVS